VVLVLDKRHYLVATLRLRGAVFASNLAGAWWFATLVMKTSAVQPEILARPSKARYGGVNRQRESFFLERRDRWMAQGMGWVDGKASHGTISQFAMVWLLTLVLGVGFTSWLSMATAGVF
jgi:hypothetical protein